MSRHSLSDLLSKAKLRIVQKASKTAATTQIVNVNLLLQENPELKEITAQVLDLSRKDEASFLTITEFLRNVDPSRYDPFEKNLIECWLRKVVAANHIKLANLFAGNQDFQLVMFDTSFYDQPDRSWLENSDFTSVVDFDGRLAKHLLRHGNPAPVIRIFFVPSSVFIRDNLKYIVDTIRSQSGKGIQCCVARADYIALISQEFICDMFLVKGELVCVIKKPYWQFELQKQRQAVTRYCDMAQTVLNSEYTIIFSKSTIDDAEILLTQLAEL